MKQFSASSTMQDVIRERPQDVLEVGNLQTGKLPGRIRTLRRIAPTSHGDVVAGDAEGDVITDATYIYTLYSISGALVWDRRAHSVAW